MDQHSLESARALIEGAQNILITAHKSPDGDAIGSSLALYHYLRAKGITAKVMMPNNYPEFLKWMPGNDVVMIYEENEEAGDDVIAKADLVFSLDYNVLYRTGVMAPKLEASEAKFIMIDHHQQPADYPAVTFSDTSSCSTCEMIYEFIEGLGDVDLIDDSAAQAMYCGIMTDSGSFRFPSVTVKTHKIVGDLIARGLDHGAIHRNVYDTNRLDRLKLIGHALSNKLEVMSHLKTAIIFLTQEELAKYDYRSGDTEGLVNQALSLDGVNFAVFMREGKKGEVKMSFRSKGRFDVNQFARTHFDGGGHMNAAGAARWAPMEQVLAEFKDAANDYEKQLIY